MAALYRWQLAVHLLVLCVRALGQGSVQRGIPSVLMIVLL